eukprot:gnl/MRDRNA2_/MRDRNA2_142011_c0_seq1.p1 gnl/MRDRNA2_/MRDRNA2_142011_c0~~gnl/MRDRNA2_/MRDRNA2_142011_c0_seq1.p1  ORF type:complete len:641 (+),score=101.58 gnl/MRDRNA2_/MRDRNA2_142011_c0_seq1:69-1991(+)
MISREQWSHFRSGFRAWCCGKVPAHEWAVRLCALTYFYAFLGNIIDGPAMWASSPPPGGERPTGFQSSLAEQIYGVGSHVSMDRLLHRGAGEPDLLSRCKAGMLLSIVPFFLPSWWPFLAAAWPLWYSTHEHGGLWFHFGWDPMMDEVGFLCILLSMSLTFYDDVLVCEDKSQDTAEVEGTAEEREALKKDTMADGEQDDGDASPEQGDDSALRSRAAGSAEDPEGSACAEDNSLQAFDFLAKGKVSMPPTPSPTLVQVTRIVCELALTLCAFRLFCAAGLVKMRRGSPCWHDGTCLYDHYETQPMPNANAWYFHNYTPQWMLRLFQFFAINLGELTAPWLLLGFLFTLGPAGMVHVRARESENAWLRVPAMFPARVVGAITILVFVCGMAVGGNYAFLHLLSAVPLVATLNQTKGIAAEAAEPTGTLAALGAALGVPKDFLKKYLKPWRMLAPVVVLLGALIAFIPSINAYTWIYTGSDGELKDPFGARHLNLGISYNHHAYFAGAVHQRHEVVLSAYVEGKGEAGKWIELDIPCKVGSVDRAPCQTSPLHRRFAWEWWFVGLGADSSWLSRFVRLLCDHDPAAWGAIERSDVHSRLDDVKKIKTEMFDYHYSKPGNSEGAWWTRKLLNQMEEMQCASR